MKYFYNKDAVQVIGVREDGTVLVFQSLAEFGGIKKTAANVRAVSKRFVEVSPDDLDFFTDEKTANKKRKKYVVHCSNCGGAGHRKKTCAKQPKDLELSSEAPAETPEEAIDEIKTRGIAITPLKLIRCKELLKAGEISAANIAEELGMSVERVESIRDQLGL